jgi:hypothetical protein
LPENGRMITLFSYPELFGVADNNPYGLKVFAFMKLWKLRFGHEHIFDAKSAPRGQLPYIQRCLASVARNPNISALGLGEDLGLEHPNPRGCMP